MAEKTVVKMSFRDKVKNFMEKVEQITIIRTIRGGLLTVTPVLIIGAFALLIKTLPIKAYQEFLANFANGLIPSCLDFIFNATFGILSLYMTASVSRSYVHIKTKSNASSPDIAAMIASLLSFAILAGVYLPTFGTDSVGPKSVFLAILTGIGATALFLRLYDVLAFRRQRRFYSSGADRDFNQMLSVLAPIALTATVFAAFNTVIVFVFRVDSFRTLISIAFDKLFSIGQTGFFKGFFFVFLSSILWFFGIHGSDTLESVMQTYFAPGLAANQAAVAAGEIPSAILTKEFFDCFVLMGGCGSAICLLIAILIFSKNRARRGLGYAAAFPMLFNINELMVFGLPIIFNPVMLIPFVAVPLVCYSVAYFAIAMNIVPAITGAVEWTTPILLGGFSATGSVAGSVLQVVNVVVGVLIYLPFVRLLDKRDKERYRKEYDLFVDYFRRNEQALAGYQLIEQKNVYGEFARALCAELKHGLSKGVILAYQPQYHYDGHCIGVEALLRWQHPDYGTLYPPIVVKLAQEGGFLPELEEAVVLQAIKDRPRIIERYGEGVKVSINVTGTTVITPRYLQFFQKLNAKDPFEGKNICLEITEQAALSFDEETINALRAFSQFGLQLAIDDFSMGQTSLNYLKENLFNVIKLDGSLVKGLFTHQNCKEIISSITRLADSIHLTVLAEYVETEDQRAALHEIGCDCYQGYLYSPAISLGKEENGNVSEQAKIAAN
ncbi:MAG: PTS sugar transporter subunit IIC/EAL domain-containing protein [Clostridia bacterium]|nr:PTS sugar transporter subunit IIC/EAL domain-containing protein [Clostridia bacterium]